jgi:hypothetical protein
MKINRKYSPCRVILKLINVKHVQLINKHRINTMLDDEIHGVRFLFVTQISSSLIVLFIEFVFSFV